MSLNNSNLRMQRSEYTFAYSGSGAGLSLIFNSCHVCMFCNNIRYNHHGREILKQRSLPHRCFSPLQTLISTDLLWSLPCCLSRIHRKRNYGFTRSYLSTPGVPKSGDVSKSSRCKNAFYDNVRILSENHPKAFRMFPMCFTTMSECSPRIPRRLSEFSRHLSVEQYQRFWSFVCMFFYH